MFQHFIRPHCHPQSLARVITSAGTFVASNMVPLLISSEKTVSVRDENYLFNALSVTGVSTTCGFYISQKNIEVQGYSNMVSVCSVSATLAGLPPVVVVMPFHTSIDLSAGPSLPIGSPTITWLPCGLSSERTVNDATGVSISSNMSIDCAFPVENDSLNANWFGLAVFGTFGTTPRVMHGSVSLRQCLDERGTFVPNK